MLAALNVVLMVCAVFDFLLSVAMTISGAKSSPGAKR